MAADPVLGGLHHVTAITGDPARNVAFYTRVLGMRLVKKTVNQDDVAAYHLFYGDGVGGPGSELTFFHWPDLPANVHGTGSVARIALQVPGADTLGWWSDRLARLGVAHGAVEDRRGRAALRFADPEGQRLELVDVGGAARQAFRPWDAGPVPPERAIRGLHGVTFDSADAARTLGLMTRLLGFRQVDAFARPDGAEVTVLEVGPGGPGTEVRVVAARGGSRAMPGIGGVHHVAYRTPDDASHLGWFERLRGAGVRSTPVIDRYYFRSLYFREPGGVLFEIATDGPGFATDEPVEHLGERLALPPFLEPRRAEIEAALPPLASEGASVEG